MKKLLGMSLLAVVTISGVVACSVSVAPQAEKQAGGPTPPDRRVMAVVKSDIVVKNVEPGHERAKPIEDEKEAHSNPNPEWNLVTHPERRDGHDLLPKREHPFKNKGAKDPTNPDQPPVGGASSNYTGTTIYYINPAGSRIGSYARQQVHLGMEFGSVNRDTTLYAPTLQTPNYCPLESVTAYRRNWLWGSTSRYFAVYNHNNNSWPVQETMDQAWVDKYARHYSDGNDYYQTEVLMTCPQWMDNGKSGFPETGMVACQLCHK